MPRRRRLAVRAFSAGILFAAVAPVVRAQTVNGYFWQAGIGGNGTWDTTTQQWSSVGSSGAIDYTWQNNGFERANFGNTGGVVQIQPSGVVVNGINFNVNGYTLAGGGGNISWVGGNVNVGNNNTGTIGAILDGTATFAKIGGGTIWLTGNNILSGGMTASSGTFILSGNNSFSGGFGISGGTVLLTNANAFTGSIDMTGGTLIGTAQASGSPFSSGSILLDSSVLRLNGIASSTTTTQGDLTITPDLWDGTGNANLIVDNTAGLGTATTTFGFGNLIRGGTGAVLAVTGQTGNLGSSEQVMFTNGNSLLTNGILPAWVVARSASNVLDFTTYGSNGVAVATYTSSDLTTSSNTDVVDQSTPPTISGPVSAYALRTNQAIDLGGNTLTLGNGAGQSGLILNGGSVTDGDIDFRPTEGIVHISGTGALGSTGNTITSNRLTITAEGPSTLTIDGNIVDGTQPTKVSYTGLTSPTSFIIDGNNTYTGGTDLEVLTGSTANIFIGNDNAFGTGKITDILPPNASSAQWQASGGARTIANAMDLASGISFTGTNGFTFTGPMNVITDASRTLQNNMTGGSLVLGTSGSPAIITLGNPVSNGGDGVGRTLAINATTGATTVVNDVFQDASANPDGGGSVTYASGGASGGTILVNSVSAYSGGTGFNGQSAIQFNHDFNAGDSTGPFGTGTIFMNNTSNNPIQPVGGDRTLANPLVLNFGFLVSNTPSEVHSITFTGPIAFLGTGRTINNSLSAGNATLTLGSFASPSTITLATNSSQTITFSTSATTVINDVIQDASGVTPGSGTIIMSGQGTLILAGQNTYTDESHLTGKGEIFPIVASSNALPGPSFTSGPFGIGTINFDNGTNQHMRPTGGDQMLANPVVMSSGFAMDNNPGETYNLTFAGPITEGGTNKFFSNGFQSGPLSGGGTLIIGDAGSPSTVSIFGGSKLQLAAIAGPIIINDVVQDGTSSGSLAINPESNDLNLVVLNAQNTYTGGTTIGTGSLNSGGIVGLAVDSTGTPGALSSGPFGTGNVTMNMTNSGSTPPVLVPIGGDRTVANSITMTSGFFVTNTAAELHSLNLTGPITLGTTSRVLTNNLLAGTTLTLGSAGSPQLFSISSNLKIQTQPGFVGNTVINDQITGGGSLTVQLGGTVYLTFGNNTYSGGTQVTGGTLVASNTTGSATGPGPVSVTGSGLLGSGGVLGGTGTITGPISISSTTAGSQGGVLSPGNSPGTLNVGNMQWNPLGQYVFEHDATSNATGGGVNDFVNGSGSLDLSTLGAGNQFDLKLAPMNIPNAPTSQSTYVLATFAQGIFDADGQLADGADLSNLFTISGSYNGLASPDVTVAGVPGGPQSLDLSFTPVPEPGTLALLGLSLGGLGLRRKRRRVTV